MNLITYRNAILFSLLIALLPFPSLIYAQLFEQQNFNNALSDTTKEKPVQYRRGIELNENYQSYEEKYLGKNLSEEKRRLFPLQSTGVWTELNPKVPRVDYLGIQFVNKDTGWAVGDLGALIKTTDGGTSWTVSETNTTTPILKVRSFNGQVVIASGFGGLILRSTDAGETFTQVTSNVTGDLWGLQMLNDTLGWACGTASSLTKTTDGGLTWQTVTTPGYTSDYWWIDFLTEYYGFIAANGKVLRTTDGGQNWEIIQAGDSYPLFSIDVIDSLHIAAAGYGGTGYRGKNIYSSDGGFTWINGGNLTYEAVNCIQYVNPDTGYVIMTNVIGKKTTNRGQDWVGIALGGEYEMQFIEEENLGYSAGSELRVYKTENSYENWQRLIINDNFSDVFFVSEEKGFAISSSGFSAPSGLYKTTDSGLNWQKHSSGLNGVDLLFLDSLTGFIAGSTIYKTTNGGENWYAVNISVTTGPIVKIFFINSTTGWAVTTYSSLQEIYILKTTDGGENWFEQYSNLFFPSFTSIYFVDSLYGWISCINGRPFKTTDSGENWVEQTNLNISQSRDVYFSDLLSGWIISGNELYYTTNSGLNWFLDPQIYTYSWHIETITDSHFIITGSNIYESIDTGQSWQNITGQTGSSFTSLHAPKNYLAYGVGTLGYIISYLDTSIVPVELISFEGRVEGYKITLNWITASEINNYGFEVQRSTNDANWINIGFVTGNGTSAESNYYGYSDLIEQDGKIKYRLKQIDFDGSFNYSKIIEIITAINEFRLSQNFPNPANPSTTISFSIPIKTKVKVSLYSIVGELVRVLMDEEKDKGIYNIDVDLNNLSSGIYFYKMLTSEGYTDVKKMILIK